MKKLLPNSTKIRIALFTLGCFLASTSINAQNPSWANGIYDGSVLPNAATPVWKAADAGAATYSIVDESGNSVYFETSTLAADKNSWKLNIAQPQNATWMIRARAGNNPVSSEYEINTVDGSAVAYRMNLRLTNDAAGGFITISAVPTSATYPADKSLNVKVYHTYRITITNGSTYNVYVDENPTAVLTGACGTSTQTQFLRFGDVGSNFTEGYTDWMAWDVTGAYAPGTTLPSGVIVDGAGPSSDATLKDLQVDGTTVTGFASGTTTYNVVLPYGTATVPPITATVNESHATTVITPAPSVTGAGTVVVTAQDASTKTYTVNFSVAAASTDATLSDLKVDGTTVTGFAAGTISYNVVLPYGTATVPTISATVNESHAITAITQAPSVPGSGTVVVTAQDASTKTYTVNFSVAAASTDATLSDLKVDGTTVTGFAAGTISYNAVLPYGTATVPTISATVNESHAITAITQAPSVTGSGTVVVTAQDASTKTYTVNFSVAAASTDATLTALSIANNTLSPVFSAGTLTYSVVLPVGTTITNLPAVTYTTAANATAVKSDATALPGATTVKVTAQDGSTNQIYTINFTVAALQSQTITFTLPTDKVYGDAAFDITGVTSGGSGNSVIFASSNQAVATVSGSTITILTAGTTTITATQAGNNSYSDATPVQHDLIVAKAPLTVTTEPATRMKGLANPAFVLKYTGFKGNDTKASLTTEPTATCAANTTSVVGNYDVVVSGGSATNYTFTYVNGTLSVTINTGTSSLTGIAVKAYPNPVVSGKLTIEVPSFDGKSTVSVTSTAGVTVITEKIESTVTELNLNAVAPGLYIIRIETPDGVSVKQIMKQ